LKFFVGIARFRLDLSSCSSLKDKRRIMKSILDRLGNNRLVGAADVSQGDFFKSGAIGLTCVSSSREVVVSTIESARRMIERDGVEIIEDEQWVLKPEDI
jgi:uncharacterized protein YlxP (DUF503 family)